MNTAKNKDELVKRLKEYMALKNSDPENINSMIDFQYADCSLEPPTLKMRHIIKPAEINSIHVMHGGLIAWMLDTVMIYLINAYADAATPTMNLTARFQRPLTEGDEAVITAVIQHIGRSVVNACADIRVEGKICADGMGSFSIPRQFRKSSENISL